MAVTKTDVFSEADAELAAAFKALSHPARIEIIRYLGREGICMCGEIVEKLPLAQATVSQHLRVLKNAGLIRGEIDGPAVCYCIDPDMFARVRSAAATYLDSITPTCC